MWPLAPPPFPAPCPALAAEHGSGHPLELSFGQGPQVFLSSHLRQKNRHRVVWLDKGDM